MIKKVEEVKNNPLVSFMKSNKNNAKAQKSGANNSGKKDSFSAKKKDKDKDENGNVDEDLSDEEKLEQAKKESNSKMQNVDKVGMIRKLILETIVKYVFMIAILVGFAILVIKAAPLIFAFFHGLISKVIFGSIT